MKAEKLIYTLSLLLSKLINFNKQISQISVASILFIKLDEAGDLVNSSPVFTLIKQQYPQAKTTIWCKKANLDLVINHPALDEFITDYHQLNSHYDLILELRGSFKSLKYALLHPPKLRFDRGTIRLKNKMKGKHPHEVQTNFEIVEPLLPTIKPNLQPKTFFSIQDETKALAFLLENEIQNFALLHVGAKYMLRRWPAYQYALLAQKLHLQYGFDIVLVGDNSDKLAIAEVQNQLDFKTFSAAGRFSWASFAALTAKAALFVGNESGPMHVAASVQIPTLGLFGPGEPFVFYPYGEKSTYIHHVLACNPCNQIHCKQPQNTCMQMITLPEVMEKINQLLR